MKKPNTVETKNMISWLISILIIANIIAFMFIANKVYFRLDLTKGQKYSVSQATEDLLAKVDNNLIIEYYYNDKCKETKHMAQIVTYITDMLQEYERAGGGSVKVYTTELNYDEDQAELDELEQKGIQPFNLSERDETQSKRLLMYSGIIIKYKNQEAVLPAVYSDIGFEFRLDIELKKLIGVGDTTLGVYVGSSDKMLSEHYKYLQQVTQREFKGMIEIKSGENIPNEVTTLVVAGGATLSDYDMFQIDQFIVNGGTAMIMQGGVEVIMQQWGFMGMPSGSKVIDLVGHYGIRINKNMIGDNDSYTGFPQQQGYFVQQARYPLWPLIKSSNFTKDHPVSADMDGLALFWASSIDIDSAAADKVTPLFNTTVESWILMHDFKLDPQQYQYPIQQGEQEYYPAYAFEGAVTSFFSGKEVPANETGSDVFSGNRRDSGQGKMIVIADDHFMEDMFLQVGNGNATLVFFMNCLDWLSKDHSLIQIRNKGKFNQPLDKYNDQKEFNTKKALIISISTVFIPLGLIIMGIVLYILMNMRRRRLRDEYLQQ
jgi:ABC-2 type transport system permease protein